MEQAIVSAVVHDVSEAKVTIAGVPDTPGVAARVFRALADRDVNVDMIVQNVVSDARRRPTSASPCRRSDLDAATEVTDVARGRDRRRRVSPPTGRSARSASSARA